MGDGRGSGAENALQSMLFYYITALIDNGVNDPKQYIATKICSMIDLAEDQSAYVKANIASRNKLLESLKSSMELLESMESSGNLDMDSLKIVKGILSNVEEGLELAIKTHTPDLMEKTREK